MISARPQKDKSMANYSPNTLTEQQAEVLDLFRNGTKTLTASSIGRTLGLSNSRARYLVTELRRAGFPIFSKRNGLTFTYTLGTPTREMIATAAINNPALFVLQ